MYIIYNIHLGWINLFFVSIDVDANIRNRYFNIDAGGRDRFHFDIHTYYRKLFIMIIINIVLSVIIIISPMLLLPLLFIAVMFVSIIITIIIIIIILPMRSSALG